MDPKDFTTPKYKVTYHPIDFNPILSFLATLSEASTQLESKDEQMRKLIDAWAEPSMSESDEKVANSIMLDAITKAMKK